MMMNGNFMNGDYDQIMKYRVDRKPEWFIAERYDYCEPCSYQNKKTKHSIFSKLKSIFKQ